MMLYQLAIPVLLFFLPWVAVRYVLATPVSRRVSYRESLPYLATAGLMWFFACALPEVPVFGGATDTFYLHVIGGAIATVLFWYVVKAYGLKFQFWWQEPVFLYAFASGLGVLNELLEFFLYLAGFLADRGVDTWWDLAANTLGLSLAYLVAVLARRLRTSG